MKYLRKLALLLAVLLLLPVPARAAEGSILVRYTVEDTPYSGAEVKLYQVDASYTDAQQAYADLIRDSQDCLASGVTNDKGEVSFLNLEQGKYLLVVQPFRLGDTIYLSDAVLLDIPTIDESGNELFSLIKDVKAEAKEDTAAEYKVLKIWKDDDPSQRPKEVQVELYCNDQLHSTVTLTSGDGENWRYTWTEEDPLAHWFVREVVPEGYTAAYTREGDTFYITNSPEAVDPTEPSDPTDPTAPSETTPIEPDDPKLPQTGQLWWPVPLMAVVGVVLVMLGWLRRKESLHER